MPRLSFLAKQQLLLVCACVAGLGVGRLVAAPPCAALLPSDTKLYVSIPNVKAFHENWEKTQFAKLLQDERIKPFAEDLRSQFRAKLALAKRVGLEWDELEAAASGEACVALVQPGGDVKAHAAALLVDVTGKETQAQALLDRGVARLVERGGQRGVDSHGGARWTTVRLPAREGDPEIRTLYYCVHQGVLIGVTHRDLGAQIYRRVGGENVGAALLGSKAFEGTLAPCLAAAGDVRADVVWFVEPFGLAQVNRAAAGGKKLGGQDILQVLMNQGFTGIQGAGGWVRLASGEHEVLHHTFVYAPGLSGGKMQLAARMLQFPNQVSLPVPNWVPAHAASCHTFSCKVKEGFEYAKTLVDELAGDVVFESVLESIEKDRYGPQVNLRKELVAHCGERATVMTDYRLPIDTKSERLLVAIEVTNTAAVARAINRVMEADPDAKRLEVAGHVVWEILSEDESQPIELQVAIEGGNLIDGDDEKPALPNSAVTVAHGHLIVATHVDSLAELLQGNTAERLAGAHDYRRVQDALTRLGANQQCARLFSRGDETLRPTYELLRQGKMPEAETLLAKGLNELFGVKEDDAPRAQRVNGANLPEFDQIRSYFGPSGSYVTTAENGWSITGCVLKR